MIRLRVALALCAFAAASTAGAAIAPVRAQTTSAPAQSAAANLTGVHDFDFQVGDWLVHHRVKRGGSDQWSEFDGTCTNRPLMGGVANVEDHQFDKPSGVSRGAALRAYDPKSAQWAIWWIDGRDPFGPLDPPVKGRFRDGVGTFYSDGVVDGKPIRTRFIWSHITRTAARWEQAFSSDSGKTWETNWVMEFRRVVRQAKDAPSQE